MAKVVRTLPRITSSSLAISHKKFHDTYNCVPVGCMSKKEVIVRGRLSSKRSAGKKLFFFDVQSGKLKVQSIAKEPSIELEEAIKELTKGSHVEIRGVPGRTETGELSIYAKEVIPLSHCQHRIPEKYQDVEKRLRHRHIDYIVNAESAKVIYSRSKIISRLRKYLEDRQFLELETPILQSSASGAAARPFETKSVLGLDLQLKIAPELALKRAVIGGFDRVFEIGKSFRNEGLSRRHNPEFTTCEFYHAYASLEDLIEMTQDLLIDLEDVIVADEARADHRARVFKRDGFTRIDFVETLEKRMGCPLPNDRESLLSLFNKLEISLPSDDSLANLYDVLASIYIEPLCRGPTFVLNHPAVLSPLSKSTAGRAHRFEFFLDGIELINAYEEENCAVQQREKFSLQSQSDGRAGSLTAEEEDYCRALEWGLPPTGGWGMGIDRLVMLLTGTKRISEVLLAGGIQHQPR